MTLALRTSLNTAVTMCPVAHLVTVLDQCMKLQVQTRYKPFYF